MRFTGSSCSGYLEPIRWPEMISLLEIRELERRVAAAALEQLRRYKDAKAGRAGEQRSKRHVQFGCDHESVAEVAGEFA
jgi:hypothetical protein